MKIVISKVYLVALDDVQAVYELPEAVKIVSKKCARSIERKDIVSFRKN